MSDPQLAVIVITPDNYQTVRQTMRHLRAQTAREQLEIVLVCPSRAQLAPDEETLRQFQGHRIVEFDVACSTAAARSAGVRAATAPVVAFAEEHSFPQPGWAAALIAAHRQPCAGVGPAIGNANPRTLTSWANLIIEYAPWLDPVPGGPVEHLPGHNSSYKRAGLLEYGDQLEAMLDAESVLHWDLRARGQQLLIEPAAKTSHFNFSRPLSSIPLRFNGGRLFAAARCRQWPWSRRLLYIVASPLIPLVRLAKLIREMARPGRAARLPWRVLPLMLTGLIIDGCGELVGYLCGPGDAMRKLTDMEFHRPRFLTTADRRAFEGVSAANPA